jgi:hypothetical protein
MSRSLLSVAGAGLVACVIGLTPTPAVAQSPAPARPAPQARPGPTFGGDLGKYFTLSNPRYVRTPTGPALVFDLVARGDVVAPQFTAELRMLCPSPDGFGEVLFPTSDVMLRPHAVWRQGMKGQAVIPLPILPGCRLESIWVKEDRF